MAVSGPLALFSIFLRGSPSWKRLYDVLSRLVYKSILILIITMLGGHDDVFCLSFWTNGNLNLFFILRLQRKGLHTSQLMKTYGRV